MIAVLAFFLGLLTGMILMAALNLYGEAERRDPARDRERGYDR